MRGWVGKTAGSGRSSRGGRSSSRSPGDRVRVMSVVRVGCALHRMDACVVASYTTCIGSLLLSNETQKQIPKNPLPDIHCR